RDVLASHPGPARRRQDIDTLIYGIGADDLGTKNAPAAAVCGEDDVDRTGIRHVARAARRSKCDALGVKAGFLRLSDAETSARDRKLENAENRGAQHARKS